MKPIIHRPDERLVRRTIEKGEERKWVLDTETSGLDVIGQDAPHTAFYIGIMPIGSPHVFVITREEFEEWDLRPLFNKVSWIGHNLRFDLHALDLDPVTPWVDTMTAAYFAHTTGRRSMDHIARMYGWPKIPTPEALKKGRILEIPEDELCAYLADDCMITGKMYERLQVDRAKFDYLVDGAVYRMERRGVRLIPERLNAVKESLDARIHESEGGLIDYGWVGNLNSSQQVGKWLLERGVKLPYSPTGKPSTSKLVLQGLADEGEPLAQMLMDWRKLMKLKTSFIDPLPKLAQNNMLYPKTNTTRTATGRFSCDTPNLQQIPKRGPLGKAIRGCLTSAGTRGVTACDFSQVELRVAAAFAEEPVLLDAFKQGRCPHTEVAAKMLGKRPDDITPEERYKAKAVNFGILNGMGAKRLALELKSDKSEATRFLDEYKRNLSSLNDWMEGVWRKAESYQIARTVAGRTRIFSRAEDTRPAISVIVQGSAAELMRHSLVAVDEVGLEPMLSVHDEILVGGTDRPEELREVMEKAADNAYPDVFSAVQFTASATIGETWGDV